MVSLFKISDSHTTTPLHWLTQCMHTPVTSMAVRKTMTVHPDYPSVLSLSDALTGWHIDNAALQLRALKQLREMPMPVVAHMQADGGRYIVVTVLIGDQITFTDRNIQATTQPMAKFGAEWIQEAVTVSDWLSIPAT